MINPNVLDQHIKVIEPHNIKVLIADDHPVFREGLKIVLQTLAFVTKISEANNGEEVLKLIRKQKFHIIFLDIDMPKKDGLEVLKEIRLNHPDLRVIMLSMHSSQGHVKTAYDLCADGYLIKETGMEEVELCVLKILGGEAYYCDLAVERVFQVIKGRYDKTKAIKQQKIIVDAELTPREIEVLKLVCQQYSSKEIGKLLNISEHTVKGHREKITRKIRNKNSIGILEYALKRGYHMLA